PLSQVQSTECRALTATLVTLRALGTSTMAGARISKRAPPVLPMKTAGCPEWMMDCACLGATATVAPTSVCYRKIVKRPAPAALLPLAQTLAGTTFAPSEFAPEALASNECRTV